MLRGDGENIGNIIEARPFIGTAPAWLWFCIPLALICPKLFESIPRMRTNAARNGENCRIPIVRWLRQHKDFLECIGIPPL
jgi:hypothetical protein